MQYRPCGNSDLTLSVITLGLMVRDCTPGAPYESVKRTVLEAVDAGITSIDFATGYGGGTVELAMGQILREGLSARRDELVIATKAGWADGTRQTLTESLDRSLQQLGLDYVDLFYHHAPDANTSLEETVGALDDLVRAGKTRTVGISNYSPAETRAIATLFQEAGTPFVAHQCNYNMLNRWVEDELLDTLTEFGLGAAIFASLGQGVLTEKSIGGPAAGSRAAGTFQAMISGAATGEPAYGRYPEGDVEAHILHMLRGLAGIASERGQTLSQSAVAWVLRQPAVSTVIVGTSDVEQMRDTIGATERLDFSAEELARIEAIIPERM